MTWMWELPSSKFRTLGLLPAYFTGLHFSSQRCEGTFRPEWKAKPAVQRLKNVALSLVPMRNRIQSFELEWISTVVMHQCLRFHKKLCFHGYFVQLLNFFAVRQKVEDRALKHCLQSPYFISHISFSLWHNFSPTSLLFTIIWSEFWLKTTVYCNDKSVFWWKKLCRKMRTFAVVLTKKTHILYAREWFILINAQHITGENILDGDSWSTHINHSSWNVFNWNKILYRWVEDCLWSRWMVDGFIFQQSNLILAVWLSICFTSDFALLLTWKKSFGELLIGNFLLWH